MATEIEDLTIERWEEGELVVKELEREVLTKGAWTTIMYKYQDIDPKTGDFKAPAARIVRYRKMHGQYKPQSKFNISSAKQGREVARVLSEWFTE